MTDVIGLLRVSPLTANPDHILLRVRRNASWLSSLLFVISMLGLGYLGKDSKLLVSSLSFWHYYLYWLAYYHGAVPPDVFRRDAIFMKTVSIIGLGSVYLAAPLNLASFTVVAFGFLLNCLAARALGVDRTYYGYELAELPRVQITTFPYSWFSHPMLIGNILAFGGTMINANFRRQWWPLACGHVAMNVGLLFMELAVIPQRRSARRAAFRDAQATGWHSLRTGACLAIAGGALAAAAGSWGTWSAKTSFAAAAGMCASAYAYALYRDYSVPRFMPANPRVIQAKVTL